jgi:hypothetical protein
MRAKYLFFFISALLLFQFTLSTSNASAADPSEFLGQEIQGRWLGSFNTKAPDHSFCIDGFRGYPRASYNWKMTEVNAPEVAYSLWRFGRDPSAADATALSWYIHATNKLGHNNAPGYTDLSSTALPSGVQARLSFIRSESYQNAGPYRLVLVMKNSVNGNNWADGTVKLVGGRGQTITDGFNDRKITLTLNGGRFGSGQASRTFNLTNGVGSFQYRRANSNINVIKGKASISYAPIKIRRFKSNVESAQRVVSYQTGDSFADNNSTAVKSSPPPADTASIRLIKHGQGSLPPSYPLEGAIFAINKSTSPPGANADRERTNENGALRFDDLETNTNYYLHEITAPAGHKMPTSGLPVPVTTGGNNSVVTALGGDPVINNQTLFDLALRKYIHAVNDQPTGQNGTGTPQPTPVKVGDIVQHRIVVFNQNETAGWAENVVDYIPEGYDFIPDLNQDWTYDETNRTALRDTGEFKLAADPTPNNINGDEPSFTVDIYLRVNSNLYTSNDDQAGVNFAEICQDGNNFDYSDIDSTPDCDQSNDVIGGDNIIDNTNNDEDDQDYDEITPQDIPASTEATKSAKVGQSITDVLNTQITMPQGLRVVFEAYPDNQCLTEAVYTSDPIPTIEGENRVEDPTGFEPATHGNYFWIARIFNPADQREYFRGECGDPNEISRVFNIVTNATKSVQLGSDIRDVALVSGDLPENSSIRFKLYAPGDSKCEQAPAYVSDLIPTVDGKTEYISEFVPTREVGIYRWVEELVGEEDNVLTRGECGIENENSHVWNISTVALAKADVGQDIYDIAIVTGSVPDGAKVRFKLHGPDDTTCQDPVFVSNTQPVPGPGYYQSSNYKTEDSGEHYWVEELLDENDKVIARGICGLENETTIVFADDTKNKKDSDNPNNTNNPDAPTSSVVDQSIPVTG